MPSHRTRLLHPFLFLLPPPPSSSSSSARSCHSNSTAQQAAHTTAWASKRRCYAIKARLQEDRALQVLVAMPVVKFRDGSNRRRRSMISSRTCSRRRRRRRRRRRLDSVRLDSSVC